MQREEKQLETLLDAVLNRLNDLKISIGAMIHKIETEFETINWPTFLDNFALISSHVSLLFLAINNVERVHLIANLIVHFPVNRTIEDPGT